MAEAQLRRAWQIGVEDALEKFGVRKDVPKEKEEETSPLARASGALAGGLIAAEAPTPFSRATDYLDNLNPKLNPTKAVPGIAAQMGVQHVPRVEVSPGAGASYLHVDPKQVKTPTGLVRGMLKGDKSRIRVSGRETESTLAHELAHARIHQATRGGMSLAKSYAAKAENLGGPLAGAYALAADDPSYVPALAHLGISAPTLIDEGLANSLALRHMMKRHGFSLGGRRSLDSLPAMGTYLAHATTPLALTALKKKYYRYKHKGDHHVEDSSSNGT